MTRCVVIIKVVIAQSAFKGKPKSDKTGENMATPKKFYPVEGGIDLSSYRLCGSGFKILQKLVQRSQS